MKILITGALGMLGHDLTTGLKPLGSIIAVDIDDFDITNADECLKVMCRHRPDIVVHAAAYTRVDDCESHRDQAMAVNVKGTDNIARACKETGSTMIYYSSDYIFDGDTDCMYTENDEPHPLSVYGCSKYEGERKLLGVLPKQHLIIRTSWLFGVNGKNFIDTVIKLADKNDTIKIVDDQHGCPTYTKDLAAATEQLIKLDFRGVINVSNTGITSWYGLAKYAISRISNDTRVLPISTKEFPLPATRPVFSALAPDKFGTVTGRMLPHWHDAVDRYLMLKNNCFNKAY